MSLTKTNRTTAGMAELGSRAKDRAKDVAAQAVPKGKRAGTTAVQGVLGAKDWAAPHVQDAVRGAREWAAPRLEDAADAVTTSVAPKVSSALRSTASQLRPEPAKTGLRRMLNWRWLFGVGAVVAAAGAAAAVAMRRRYASATAAAKADTEPDGPAQAEDSSAEGSSVNGRVTTPGM